mmetsp:Transcript_1034/g.1240  ORF Transcript_1034/g.1240 Transcript_1034/m.1240 type:complete len:144 (-) Transcript_1034:158-589(-)
MGDISLSRSKTVDAIKLRNENHLLRIELQKLRRQSEESKQIEERDTLSFDLTNSLSSASTSASFGTQTESNEYTIFGQVIRNVMCKFPELKQRVIGQEDFMSLFLIYNQMQSNLVQEINRNAGFPNLRQVASDVQSEQVGYSR